MKRIVILSMFLSLALTMVAREPVQPRNEKVVLARGQPSFELSFYEVPVFEMIAEVPVQVAETYSTGSPNIKETAGIITGDRKVRDVDRSVANLTNNIKICHITRKLTNNTAVRLARDSISCRSAV